MSAFSSSEFITYLSLISALILGLMHVYVMEMDLLEIHVLMMQNANGFQNANEMHNRVGVPSFDIYPVRSRYLVTSNFLLAKKLYSKHH